MWLHDNNTHPDITHTIISRLRSWRNSSEPETFTGISLTVQSLVTKQDAIGWEAAFRGCWSKGWAKAQERYFLSTNSKRTGERWLAALINKLWLVAWDMWEHRNGILHDREQGQLAQSYRRQIQQEYSKGFRGLPPDLRRVTRIPMAQVLQKPLRQQEIWLGRIQDGRNYGEAEEQQASRNLRIQQTRFRNFFASAQQS